MWVLNSNRKLAKIKYKWKINIYKNNYSYMIFIMSNTYDIIKSGRTWKLWLEVISSSQYLFSELSEDARNMRIHFL